ncbi:MAG: hypothetical protein AAF715_19450 [Myxococcota bacterium]
MSLADTLRQLAALPPEELRRRLSAAADALDGKLPSRQNEALRPRRKRVARTDRAHIERLAREKGVKLEP